MLTSAFFWKKKENISALISLEFALTYRKVITFITILKLLANGNIKKNTFETFSTKKSLQQGLKRLWLPLVKLKYSLNNFCSQAETNDMQNRLATSIFNIKSRVITRCFFFLRYSITTRFWVTTRFLKSFQSVFNLYGITFRLGFIFPHPLRSKFDVCILGYTNKKLVYACFLHLFLIKWPFCFFLRSFREGGMTNFWNNKRQAKSRKYYTRGTGYVSRDLCIAWCADNVRSFCAKLGPCGKSRSLQKLLETTKKNGGSHTFFRDN